MHRGWLWGRSGYLRLALPLRVTSDLAPETRSPIPQIRIFCASSLAFSKAMALSEAEAADIPAIARHFIDEDFDKIDPRLDEWLKELTKVHGV